MDRVTSPLQTGSIPGWPASRFLLLIVAAVLVSSLLIGGLLLRDAFGTGRERQQENLLHQAQAVRDAVDRQVQDSITVLQVLASSTSLLHGHFETLHARLKGALEGRRAHILVLDRDLNQIINTRAAYGTPLGMTADPESALAAAERRAPFVSGVFYGKVAQAPVFDVVLPVFDDDELRYFLIMTRNTEWLRPLLNQASEGTGAMLLDQNGRVVAGGDLEAGRRDDLRQALAFAGGQARVQTTAVAGVEYVYAEAASSLSGWPVVTYLPKSRLDAPLERSLWRLAGFALVILGLAMAAVVWVTRQITRPLGSLARLADDRSDVPAVPLDSRVREINVAAAALREAAAERAQRTEHLQVLLREMAHSMRNQFAVIDAIFRQTAAGSGAPEQFQAAFLGRLRGLGRSVDVLSQEGTAAALRDLVQAHLQQFVGPDEGRVRHRGPDVRINPRAASVLGLALHELATNSIKYGALSGDTGTVSIAWNRDSDGAFRLSWTEAGGPPVEQPTRTGFGTLVLERIVAQQLNGSAELSHAGDGIAWRMRCPWPAVAEEDTPA